MVYIRSDLGTLEARRNSFLTRTKDRAERDWNIEVDSKHIGLNGSAETKRSFQIRQVFDQSATVTRRRSSNNNVHES